MPPIEPAMPVLGDPAPVLRIVAEPSWRRTFARLAAVYGYTIVSTLTSVVSIPLFLHYLGRREFGAWIVASSVAGYALLLQFGIAQATANAFGEALHQGDDEAAVSTLATGFWSYARLTGPVATALLVAFGVVAIAAPRLTTVSLCLLATSLFLVDLPFTVIESCAFGAGEVAPYRIAAAGGLIFRLLAGIVALQLGTGATGLVVSQGVAGVFLHVAMWLRVRRTLPTISLRPHYHQRSRRQSLNAHGAGFFAIQLGGTIVFALDTVVISTALGTAAVTPYAIAQRVFVVVGGLVSATVSVFYPDMIGAKIRGSAGSMHKLFTRVATVGAIALGACFAVTLVCARPAIEHWVGADNVLDRTTFFLLFAVFTIQMLIYPYDLLLTSTSEHRRYGAMSLVEAVVNLSLSVLLVRPFGVAAVAGATLVGRLTTTVPTLVRGSARLLQTSVLGTLEGLRAVVLPVMLSTVSMLVLQRIIGTGAVATGATAAAGVAVYGFCLAVPQVVRVGPHVALDRVRVRVRQLRSRVSE